MAPSGMFLFVSTVRWWPVNERLIIRVLSIQLKMINSKQALKVIYY